MKKIIALLLILVCVFSLAACKDVEGEGLEAYKSAVSNTSATSITIETKLQHNALGVTIEGKYDVVIKEDGSAKVDYTYDKYNLIGSAELTTPVAGEATVAADGTVTGDISATVVAATVSKLNLEASKLSDLILERGGILKATVKAADTKSVLGIELGADADLTINLTSDGKIGSYSVIYAAPEGTATIVVMYK